MQKKNYDFRVTIPVTEPPPNYDEQIEQILKREMEMRFGPDVRVERLPPITLPRRPIPRQPEQQ